MKGIGFFSVISFSTYMSKLNSLYEEMSFVKEYNSLVELLDKGYLLMKSASANLCNSKNNNLYDLLKNKMVKCEELCSEVFIVDSNPLFDVCDSRFVGKSLSYIDKKDFLDYIVWFTRMRLLETHQDQNYGEFIDFNNLSLMNDCKLACNIIKLVCDTLLISCDVVKIPPAFTDEFPLYRGNGFHYFCLVTLDDKKYIIDTTYRQFFTLDSNNINRLGVMGLNGCKPGVYMMMNESRLKTALGLLRYGFIEANSENLKNYFDGFSLSFRNGLYYEKIGKNAFTTPYTIDEYFKMLNGEFLLFDYEPISCIGEQRIPLNNSKFRFKN
ncbi:MAG: hypothetical protein ACI4XM_08715 [Candidatus Coprovivens sp.]